METWLTGNRTTKIKVFADDCGEEKRKELGNGVVMICRNGVWRVSRRSRPKGPPCTDDPSFSANGICSADEGHCNQYTDAGKNMTRDCPGTCGSCDGCRCQDASQWHTYCPLWAQYCSSSGVLGTWMTSNCRKTCGKCKCKCCSYGGKQHQLGARIRLPDKCGELICEEDLIAGYSPLLSGAAGHKVSHPEELTLNFRSVHDGADCCILPGNARNTDGSSFPNGTMVQEGWKGIFDNHGANVLVTCCHGVLCTPLNGTNQTSPTTNTLPTTTTSTTTTTTTTSTTTTTTTTSTTTTTTTTSTTTTTTTTSTTTTTTTTSTTTTTTTTSTTTTTTTTTITYFPDVVIRLRGSPFNGWNVGPGQVDAIDLTSSSDILMRGISLLGSLSGSDIRNGKIQLKETASQKIIISENFQFTSNGKGDYFDHIFSSPGNVKAGVKYTVTVEYDDTQRIYYAVGGLARTTAACNGKTVIFEFSDSKDDNNSSDTDRGQIPRILISC